MPDNYGYPATAATKTACHLRERPVAVPLRFSVIWQPRARGREGRPWTSCRPLLARHIDDFLTDRAKANRPRNTVRGHRGGLIAFAAHLPVRAFLGEIAELAPATRKRKRAAVAFFCRGRSSTIC